MRLIIAVLSAASLCAGAEPLLLQKPTLNKTHIVFVYAGDLWSVPRDGGDAVRLTSGAGNETDPAFSPDSSQIAFTGEYDGNVDVFVMPASGGVPKRLTWHPAPDRVLGWTPDGQKIIFTSTRSAYSRYGEMFSVRQTEAWKRSCLCRQDTEHRYQLMANRSPTNRSCGHLVCGRTTGAARPPASGSLAFPTAA